MSTFSDEPGTQVMACKHVGTGELPALQVTHDSEGGWQFMCNVNEHGADDLTLATLGAVAEHDATLAEVADLPPGAVATRAETGGDWEFEAADDDDF